MRETKIEIKNQGAPIVEDASVFGSSENVAVIFVDMKSKYCCTSFYSENQVSVYANEESIYLNKEYSKDKPTIVSFPEFNGWEVLMSHGGRYTLEVCLIKRSEE